MVAIFTRTTSVLSAQFVCKFSADTLAQTLSNVQKETGVEFCRQRETFSISGNWNDIIKAHQSLEQLYSVSEYVGNKAVDAESAYGFDTFRTYAHAQEKPDAEKVKPGRKPGSTVRLKSRNSTVPEPIIFNSQNRENWITAKDISGTDTISSINDDVGEKRTKLETVTNKLKVNVKQIDSDDSSTDVDEQYLEKETYQPQNRLDEVCSQSVLMIKTEIEEVETCTSLKECTSKEEKKGVNFETQTRVKNKNKINSNGTKRFVCTDCDYVTSNKENLKSHRKRKHRLKKFTCDVCEKQFGVNRDLQRHKKVHSDAAYSCDTCKKSYRSKKAYTGHIKTHVKVEKDMTTSVENVHDNSLEEVCEEDFRCKLCAYVGTKRYLLKEHQKRMHRNKFKCEVCEKTFGFNKDLNRHKKFVHSEPAFLCEICKKFYRSKRSFDEHLQTHKDNYVKENFSCEQCPKKFSTKYVLAAHVKSEHLGIKNSFVCQLCGKSFTQRNSYLIHANVHAGIKPHVCDICGVSFAYENSYRRHRMIHDSTQKFPCTLCDKVFAHPSNLNTHMKIHKNKRDYLCTVCGKGFTQRQALTRHERIHTGDKPYVCELCNRSFTDYSIIRRHLILMHKKDTKNWKNFIISHVKKSSGYFIEQVVSSETKVTETDTAIDKLAYINNYVNQEFDQKFSAQDPPTSTQCLTGNVSHDTDDMSSFNTPPTQSYSNLLHAQVNKPLHLVSTSYPSDSLNNCSINWSHLSGNLPLPAESILQHSDTQLHY